MKVSLGKILKQSIELFRNNAKVFILSSLPIVLFSFLATVLSPDPISQKGMIDVPGWVRLIVSFFSFVVIAAVTVFQTNFVKKIHKGEDSAKAEHESLEKITPHSIFRTIYSGVVGFFVAMWPAILMVLIGVFLILLVQFRIIPLVISDLLFFSATGTKMPLFFMLYGMVVLILSIVRSLTYTQIINLSVLEIETVHASVKKSKEIMKGNKFKILVIMVCYFALAFLSALTFGITMVVLQPLMSIVMTLFTLSAVELHYQNTQSSFSKEDIQNTL